MRRIWHTSIWRWAFLFVGVWLAAAVVTGGVLRLAGAEAGSGALPLECGRHLTSVSGERLTVRSVRVVLALDEEWRELFGGDSGAVARSLVSDVSGLYRDIGMHLLPVRIVEWSSPDDVLSAEDLALLVNDAIPLDGADIVVGLTGQRLPTVDGFATVGGQVAVVGHHPGSPERDVLVLAHEVGHLFGAHHGCDIPGLAGVMADSGYEDPLVVCPCTRAILEANVARFHED